ncbi:hypothetical protein NDU88_002052 [Pleurodeles waltl]|uniref:Uncharacterized protein n=1 Tax=Pleurodeles waltl TaxID=8319 RepID=A0AAV7T258_PLEWA|nr:hypothetical protein NDU88_002052 [Pleurodeles waltl]
MSDSYRSVRSSGCVECQLNVVRFSSSASSTDKGKNLTGELFYSLKLERFPVRAAMGRHCWAPLFKLRLLKRTPSAGAGREMTDRLPMQCTCIAPGRSKGGSRQIPNHKRLEKF